MTGTKPKLAILDLYAGVPNQGMRCIKELVARYEDFLDWKIFDVRLKDEVPSIEEYDFFISSGGPGNPLDVEESWSVPYFDWLQSVVDHNNVTADKKYVFFICHSFQMACAFFELGKITERKAMSFGLYPVHKTEEGKEDILLDSLADPFYVIDSRYYQVVQPKKKNFQKKGAKILALEKIRDHVTYERAIMAIRFSDEMVGVQFHPEADPLSFIEHLKDKKKKEEVIRIKGRRKFRDMMEGLMDEEKVSRTREVMIPEFIERSLASRGIYAELSKKAIPAL